ncbi:MAG TPA: hypothetical protein VHW69_13290 [Rhizomicrobium sp.]|nr:hypothetical protein [Rhizomicrobium sp.]
MFLAYCGACEEIERWQNEQVKPEGACSPSDILGKDAQAEPEEEESERDGAEDDENAVEDEQEADGREREDDAATLRNLLERRRVGTAQKVPVPEPPACVPAVVEPVRMPVLLRGVKFDADVPGRWTRHEPAVPQLDIDPPLQALPAADAQTETLLNAIIGECHFLMREVAFRSMCQAGVAEDRVNWVNTAMRLAETGAKVAKSVGRLRHGPEVRQSHHDFTVTNKVAVVAQGGGGPTP